MTVAPGEPDTQAVTAIRAAQARFGRPVLIMLAGAQGSGKSTLAGRLAARLDATGVKTAVLALDDFYLTRGDRRVLAASDHPLLATRGVPGTHAIDLLANVLDDLLAGKDAVVPIFDKRADDRVGEGVITDLNDVVLLEGWCLGAQPQDPQALRAPVNALETRADADGRWRGFVNDQLAGAYAALFARADLRLFLKAPGFSVVADWRLEQERGLGPGGMTPAAIAHFVAHYERVTRAMLADEPADLVLDLDPARRPLGTWRAPAR